MGGYVPGCGDCGGGGTAPAFLPFGTNGIYANWFADAGTDDELHGIVQMKHGYKQGTDVDPHIHWVCDTPAVGANSNVVWELNLMYAPALGGTYTNVVKSYYNCTITAGVAAAWAAQINDFVDIPAVAGGTTNITESSVFLYRIVRRQSNAADNYPHPAAGLDFDMHFEIHAPGSTNEYPVLPAQ